jgi:2-polyprenyl-3-methyl-5-hydroxy-6-metoxy-1,4-benzoquinol methylase
MLTTLQKRQQQQYKRFEAWARDESTEERPVQLSTYMEPIQQARIQWLSDNCLGTIVEVGCSWGYVLAKCGGQCGIDINPRLVELATALNRDARFLAGDARDVPLTDQSFDTVLLTEILEHVTLEDVPKVLTEAIRIARQRILITIPMGDHDTKEAICFKHRWLCDSVTLDNIIQQNLGEYHVELLHDGTFYYLKACQNAEQAREKQ